MPKTFIERRLSEILNDLGLKHICNARVDRYEIDALLERYPVAIEADGTLWHGGERMRRDKLRDAILHRQGYKVIRIWGTDLVRNPGKVREKLIVKLAGIVDNFQCLNRRELAILLDVKAKRIP